MMRTLRYLFGWIGSYQKMQSEIDRLNDELDKAISKKEELSIKYNSIVEDNKKLRSFSEPELVVANIMKRGIRWYDYKEIKSKADREFYIDKARDIVQSPVYKNEIKRAVYDIMQHIVEFSKSHNETRDLRMTINGIELLKTRLENIFEPETAVSRENIHEAI